MYSVQELYNNDKNYKVVSLSGGNTCYIFCSSNGLNQIADSIDPQVFSNDYYEWNNISKNKRIKRKAGKYIFVRDVFQKSYVDGINKDINSIDKIIELLCVESAGYDVVCVGSSGGGYLAMILGAKLKNCSRVFSFGGLFSLYSWTGANNNFVFSDIEAYQKHIGEIDYEKYYSIRKMIESYDKPLFHFYGINHFADCVQINELNGVSNKNVFLIGLKTGRHGGDFFGFTYPYLLSKSNHKMRMICDGNNVVVSKIRFAIRVMGLFPFLAHSFERFLKKHKRQAK